MEALHLLGKEVKVIIDRPINSKHPKHSFVYELNYGYIPNTMAGDGMEIDVYVMGEEQPLETFLGIVKAIIIRHDDNENKLVVTKKDYKITKEEIVLKTKFQEQYFETEIRLMK